MTGRLVVVVVALAVLASVSVAAGTAGFDAAELDRPVVASVAGDAVAHVGVSTAASGGRLTVTVTDRAPVGLETVTVRVGAEGVVASPAGPGVWTASVDACDADGDDRLVVVGEGPDVSVRIDRPVPPVDCPDPTPDPGSAAASPATGDADGDDATTPA